MSFAALCRASLQILRGNVALLSSNNSQVTFDAQPPAWSGSPLFVCVYPTVWVPSDEADPHEATIDQYAITIAINARTSPIPRDRWGPELYLNQCRGVEVFAKTIRTIMYRKRYSILNLANQYILPDRTATDRGPLVEPLEFSGMPRPPRPVAAGWFHAQDDVPDIRVERRKAVTPFQVADDPQIFHGVLLELDFAGAKDISPSPRAQQMITVNFQATTSTQPALSGSFAGQPLNVSVIVGGNGPYNAALGSGGAWTIAQGVIAPLPPGTYDVMAQATYSTGEVIPDDTTDELTILDPTNDWIWTDGSPHRWSDDSQAYWTPGA